MGCAAWIANGRGTYQLQTGAQHCAQLLRVRRRHHGHTGHATQISEIEPAVVRRSIGSDKAAAIDGKQHRQILQANVVDHLIERALQKSRINGDDRF